VGAPCRFLIDVCDANSAAALDQAVVEPNVAGADVVQCNYAAASANGRVIVVGEALTPDNPAMGGTWVAYMATFQWTQL